MDEFLCSGETMIRNLEMGWTTASALGDPMPVGYLPDMFWALREMPQILRRAGLAQACVWRGVPGGSPTTSSSGARPIGSAIRTEYLPPATGTPPTLFLDSAERRGRRVRARPARGPDGLAARVVRRGCLLS